MTNNTFKQINFTALKYKDSWNVISIINDLQLKYELTVALRTSLTIKKLNSKLILQM